MKIKKLVQGHGLNDVTEKVAGTPAYIKWADMLKRCYSTNYHAKYPTYLGCIVSEEWLTFSNFKSWFDEHNIVGMHLDKDLLVKDNKVYSADTCIFVSPQINTLMNDRANDRGDLPIGVHLHECGKYQAQLNIKGKRKKLGHYTHPEQAYNQYLYSKIEYIQHLQQINP